MLASKMMGLCIRYMKDRDEAEDVLQEGFITMFNQLAAYQGRGSFEGWARRIFVTTALMHLRKNDALKQSEDISEIRFLSDCGTSALEMLSHKELLKLVSELPDGFRIVFNMYVIEGYTHKEISEILNISEVTSRSQLSRARQWLKDKITSQKL